MKEYQIKPKCNGCRKCFTDCDICDTCPNEDEDYRATSDYAFTITYGDLLAIPEKSRDPLMREIDRILRLAERVGRQETDYGEFKLALEKMKIDSLDLVEFLDDGSFRLLELQAIPAAFSGKYHSSPANFRILVQDHDFIHTLNQYELDLRFFGENISYPNPFRHWHIWHADDVAENLVEESARLGSIYRRKNEIGEALLKIIFETEKNDQTCH